jgi:hypothetical protein
VLERGDEASRFTHDDDPGTHVPCLNRSFPETIEATGGDPAQVKRGGTVAADAPRGGVEGFPHGVLLGAVGLVVGKAGGKQRLLQFGNPGDVDRLAVQRGAVTLAGGEEFVAHRVVHDAHDGTAAYSRQMETAKCG